MKILGLSAFYHDSACCVLVDGRLAAAAQEERFSRLKHDARLPVRAVGSCLAAAGLGVEDLDAVAYYERPVAKLARQLWAGPPPGAPPDLPWLDPERPLREIRERLGVEAPILTFPHHASHAASAFFFSGWPSAAVLTADGVGEWATTTYGRGEGSQLEIFDEVAFPHSLGLFYSTFTAYLGFAVNDGEYKLMGLAPYGEPVYAERLASLLRTADDGRFALDLAYFDFVRGGQMAKPALEELLGEPARKRGAPITRFHQDVARSVQLVLEELLLQKVEHLHQRTGEDRLCLAGGVALNCVANGRIRREGPFREIFVQPAAGDAGGSLGAAVLAHRDLTGQRPAVGPLEHVYLGPRWSADEVAGMLRATGLPAHDYRGREPMLLAEVAARLARQEVVGWFQGAMELGPRALGARSLLADPRDPLARDRLNALVKKREAFRPFAPSVLAAAAAEHFELDHPSPFMLETCKVRSPLALPAVEHVDGSARPQTVAAEANPRFAGLLEAFARLTGCPVLLNTSFNVAGEPIVCSPIDALSTFAEAGFDALVLEDLVLDRRELPAGWAELVRRFRRPSPGSGGRRSAVAEHLYTFV